MKQYFKIIFAFMFLITLPNKSFSVNFTGEATEYKITMTYLELCDSTSTLSSCNNPVVIGTGTSGLIDIANTTEGAQAAAYGKLDKAPFGKSYPMYQVTMKREIQIAGTVSDGTNTCRTSTDNASSYAKNRQGATAGTIETVTLYMAFVDTSLDSQVNSVTAGNGLGTSRAAGTVTSGDEYFEYRGSFTQPVLLEPGRIPTIKLAFGTVSALGYMGANGGCATAGDTDQGLYGDKPDVTATVIY